MHRVIKILSSILLSGFALSLSATGNEKEAMAVFGSSAVATALSQADVALAKSVIIPGAFRGILGESLAGKFFLKELLSETGNWHSITPRSGPQGFDHVFIKTDQYGIPRRLIVAESKFNTSRLGITKHGIQMGSKWTNARLKALASRYFSIADMDTAEIHFGKVPFNPNRQHPVILQNGKERFFWKESSQDPHWKFSGTKNEVKEACKLAKSYGAYFQGAGEGKIIYMKRIFNTIPKGNSLELNVYDVKNIETSKSISSQKKLSTIPLKNVLSGKGKLLEDAKKEIAKILKSKLHLADAGANSLAHDINARYSAKDLMKATSLTREIVSTSARSLLVAAGLDATIQCIVTGEIDLKQTAISGGSLFGGVAVGQFIQAGFNSVPFMQNSVRNIAGPLPVRVLSKAISSGTGAIIATAIYSYASYFSGYSDLTTANRNMIVGSAAVASSSIFCYGTMALVAAYGTASAGTPIAMLTGAAATKASLACLGGGSLAAGGGGAVLGSAVLMGGTIILAAVVSYTGYKLYQLYDEKVESDMICDTINYYNNEQTFDKMIRNSPYIQALRLRQ